MKVTEQLPKDYKEVTDFYQEIGDRKLSAGREDDVGEASSESLIKIFLNSKLSNLDLRKLFFWMYFGFWGLSDSIIININDFFISSLDREKPELSLKGYSGCKGSPSQPKRGEAWTQNYLSPGGTPQLDHSKRTKIYLRLRGYLKQQPFSAIFGSGPTTCLKILNRQGSHIIYAGINCTLFAYGRTGAGKTYTLQGPAPVTNQSLKQEGIVGMILQTLLSNLKNAQEREVKFQLKARYIELYLKCAYDLFQKSKPEVEIHVLQDGAIFIKGAKENQLESINDALDAYRLGSLLRETNSTKMNNQSSRSHSIFTLSLEFEENEPNGHRVAYSSQMNIVDLAGNENFDYDGTKKTAQQAKFINQSLSTLTQVIDALSEGKSVSHLLRNSNLTLLLADSLGGNCKTVLLANISPSSSEYQATLRTLNFAKQAKKVINKAVINEQEIRTVEQLELENKSLRMKLLSLEKHLKLCNFGSDVKQHENQQLCDLKHQLVQKDDKIFQLNQELRAQSLELSQIDQKYKMKLAQEKECFNKTIKALKEEKEKLKSDLKSALDAGELAIEEVQKQREKSQEARKAQLQAEQYISQLEKKIREMEIQERQNEKIFSDQAKQMEDYIEKFRQEADKQWKLLDNKNFKQESQIQYLEDQLKEAQSEIQYLSKHPIDQGSTIVQERDKIRSHLPPQKTDQETKSQKVPDEVIIKLEEIIRERDGQIKELMCDSEELAEEVRQLNVVVRSLQAAAVPSTIPKKTYYFRKKLPKRVQHLLIRRSVAIETIVALLSSELPIYNEKMKTLKKVSEEEKAVLFVMKILDRYQELKENNSSGT